MDAQIKKITERWVRHVSYVFTGIIVGLLSAAATILVQGNVRYPIDNDSRSISDYLTILPSIGSEQLWTLTKGFFILCCKLIAFPLIAVLLYLIFYTIYIIICIIRKTGFNDHIFRLLGLLALSNCIFWFFIGHIRNHCLQALIPNGFLQGLAPGIIYKFLFQLSIITLILLLRGSIRFASKEEMTSSLYGLRSTAKRFFRSFRLFKVILLLIIISWLFYNINYIWIDKPTYSPYVVKVIKHLIGVVVVFIFICFFIRARNDNE